MYTPFHALRRGNGQQGYVPANYVKDIEPGLVKTKVMKKVIEEVPVKVKEKQVVKRRLRKQKVSKGPRAFSSKQMQN